MTSVLDEIHAIAVRLAELENRHCQEARVSPHFDLQSLLPSVASQWQPALFNEELKGGIAVYADGKNGCEGVLHVVSDADRVPILLLRVPKVGNAAWLTVNVDLKLDDLLSRNRLAYILEVEASVDLLVEPVLRLHYASGERKDVKMRTRLLNAGPNKLGDFCVEDIRAMYDKTPFIRPMLILDMPRVPFELRFRQFVAM